MFSILLSLSSGESSLQLPPMTRLQIPMVFFLLSSSAPTTQTT
ncbi:unnamed protein product [Brassica oleracea var. botrytis]